MGRFDSFRKASVMGVRAYIEEGTHYLFVKRTEQSMSKHPKKQGQEKTVVEFKILETDSSDPKMAPGKMCSLVETEASQGYHGNVLAFTAGALGLSTDEFQADDDFESIWDSVWGQEAILVGMVVKCTAQKVATTSPDAKSDVYTAKTFEAVPASEYARWDLVAPNGAYAGPEASAAA